MARRLVLNGALNRAAGLNPAGAVAAVSGPRYAFISNPACCPKCSAMDSRRTGRLFTVSDPWRISHINCLCSTVEVPAGVALDPQSVIAFATNPVGGILRRGFNFGQSFAPQKLTEGNLEAVLGNAARMATLKADGTRRALARAKITAQRKGAYRKAFNRAGEAWNDVLAEQPKAKAMGIVKARKEAPVFTPTGRVSKSATVKAQKMKRDAAKVVARRSASRGTRDLARLFGAIIK